MPTYSKLLEGISAVIFDLDGTLIDSHEAQARAWQDVFSECGHSLDLALVKSLLGLPADQLIARAIGPIPEKERVGIDQRRSEIFLDRYLHDAFPVDKANELILLLKSRGLAVLLWTAADPWERDALLERAELEGQFHLCNQPEASASRSLLGCLQGHELEPHQCLLIADTPHDGSAAQDAGMTFLGVETGGWNAGSMPNATMVVPSLAAIYRGLQAATAQDRPAAQPSKVASLSRW
jgi:phosphoglycolate phosphatase-like HAD superfamily hydrolase